MFKYIMVTSGHFKLARAISSFRFTSHTGLVHLDLKGAPPKIAYYEQVFPLFKKWGATGLLVEYEDVFPYDGELACLQAKHAYSATEIQQMQALASHIGLEVIPLVQTFGHFEFVLKHEKFKSLREVETFPMALCPCKQGRKNLTPPNASYATAKLLAHFQEYTYCMAVLKEMIDQMLKSHSNITFFHIGADEVYHIGLCNDCKAFMVKHNSSISDLFFYHVKRVLEYIKSVYPHITCIMWDDMFRDLSADLIKKSGIGELVEPMVWYYQHTFVNLPTDLWDRYSQGFTNIWAASAFKGATGSSMYVTNIDYHINNHVCWLEQESTQISPKFSTFRGYCVTGWQRYDHYATLCELLPVGLPSLAICLLVLKTGAYTVDVLQTAALDLKFKNEILRNPYQSVGEIPECSFPGSDIYVAMQRLVHITADYHSFTNDNGLNCWLTPYHVTHNFTNPAHLKHFIPIGKRLLDELKQFAVHLTEVLAHLFYPSTADELITNMIRPKVEKVSDIVDTIEKQIAVQTGSGTESAVESMD